MDFLKLKLAKRTFILSFLFAWNVALTAYINSTFLDSILSAELIGFVFALGAMLTLIGLEWLPNLLKKEGNVRTTSLLILLSVSALLGLHMSETLPIWLIVFLFVIYNSTNSLVAYCFDLFFEHFSQKETVGRERGLYLTITNFAWLLAPLLSLSYILPYFLPYVFSLFFLLYSSPLRPNIQIALFFRQREKYIACHNN